MSRPTVRDLLDDLDAERADLLTLVRGIGSAAWTAATPAPGWSVRDQIAHLAFLDHMAEVAVADPGRFGQERAAALSDTPAYERDHLRRVPDAGPELLDAWAVSAAGFRAAALARSHEPKARVPWYGPDMGLLSMITARLMETWAHGADVAGGLGIRRTPTDRLRHVAAIAVRARAYGYVVRDMEPSTTPVRVALTAPSGEIWTFGPDKAGETVTGSAEEFCLVLTRRRHVDDTAIVTTGPAGREWLEIGQAYAGPPGPGPRARG